MKLNTDTLKGTLAGMVVLFSKEVALKWKAFGSSIEGCFIASSEGDNFEIDPFKLKAVVDKFSKEEAISRCLDEELLQRLICWYNEECRRCYDSFESKIRQFAGFHNVSITGRYPKYVLNDFLALEVNERGGTCLIGEMLIRTACLESLNAMLLQELRAEKERQFNRNTLLQELLSAYKRVIGLNGLEYGSTVLLREIYFELVYVKQSQKFRSSPNRKNFNEYPREHFSRDLAKLIMSGSYLDDGITRVDLMPISSAAEGIPVIVGGMVRFLGRLAFTREQDNGTDK